MKYKYLVGIVLLAVFAVCQSENSTFEATEEWKEIKEGQKVPAGLHVRINLQTGKKEAKLLEKEDANSTKALTANKQDGEAASTDSTEHGGGLRISKTLEDALKNLPREKLQLEYSQENLEALRKKFRSAEEVKKDFDQIKDQFKTDSELMAELLNAFSNATDAEEMAAILEDFEYFVHQYDNAQWFIAEGGLEKILLPMIINQTDANLRVKAIRILGAIVQNHVEAKMQVLQRNFGAHLVQVLMNSKNSDELSGALFAFGSLLRGFPYGQKEILSKIGTKALITVLSNDNELRLKTKVLTLISDLIKEGAGEQKLHGDEHKINLEAFLLDNDFCTIAENVVADSRTLLLDQPDLMEHCVQAMSSTLSICGDRWKQSAILRHTLLTLRNRFQQSGDEFRIEVADSIAEIVRELYPAGAHAYKDEL